MPRAKRSADDGQAPDGPAAPETKALAEALRGLAARIEANPGLLADPRGQPHVSAGSGAAVRKRAPSRTEAAPPLDPFATLRHEGEAALAAALGALDGPALKAIVRAHRLDPARISARWNNPARLIDLIVEQVHARLNRGRAFERV